jgi:Mrp family chromosome partitioning ATPase
MVMSVKGGTGKSLSAIQISVLLSRIYRVGLLDADVDSPNLPKMLNLTEPMQLDSRHTFIPATYNGLRVVSTGLFQKGIFTVCKTGTENRQIVSDLLKNTLWADTQIIVVDQPAGSDEELRAIIHSGHPFIGVVLITQPTTYDDCFRVIEICTRFKIRVLGVIENMVGAVFEDGTPVTHPTTGRPFLPFGDPQGECDIQTLARNTGIEYIGSVPVVENVVARMLSGNPLIPDSVLPPYIKVIDKVKEAMK